MLPKLGRTIVLLISILVTGYYFLSYGPKASIYHGDAFGYYLYLPDAIIYHNLDSFDILPLDRQIPGPVLTSAANIKNNNPPSPKGYIINQYTYGVALMELPFFLGAHGYEKMKGLPANGFSDTYRDAIRVSSVVYGILGLILVYLVLRRYFGTNISLIATLCVLLGTNLFWFMTCQPGMAHVPLFFLYALLIYLTVRLHEQARLVLFIAAGLTAGLITIIRPTDILCLLIPLLFKVYDKDSLRAKALFLKAEWGKLLCFAVVFVLPIVPQMVYWKELSGSYVYYSYGQQAFHWDAPKIIEGVFYFSNGWLVYTPLMVFSLLGFFCLRQIREWSSCLLAVTPVYIYIIYSWYCYNYINGFGSRPMIHIYPLLALPLAALIQYISTRDLFLRSSVLLVFLFCVLLNLSWSAQQAKGILLSEESNYQFNKQTLFRMHLRYEDLVVNDNGQEQPARTAIEKVKTLRCETFDDSLSVDRIPDPTTKSRFVHHLADQEYGPEIKLNYDKLAFGGAKWIRASGRFMYTQPPTYWKHLLVLDILRGDQHLSWTPCKIDNKIGISDSSCEHFSDVTLSHFELNRWGGVYFFVRLPEGIQDGDLLKLHIWNTAKTELFIDDLCLELYR